MAETNRIIRKYANYLSFAFKTFVLGKELPYMFVLVINDMCNLSCFYCRSKNTGRYDMDFMSVVRMLEHGHSQGHRALVITGGEPMMWESRGEKLGKIVGIAKDIGFHDIAVYTNGTFPLDIRDCSYIVTIDGTRETHNAIRNGSYDRILRNVKEAKSQVVATITINKANCAELERIVEDIVSAGVFSGISFNLFTGFPEDVKKYGLTGADRLAVLDRLWTLKNDGYPLIFSKAAYQALRKNNWKRPISQIRLATKDEIFTCCRDVGHPEICENCGYSGCAEISQALTGKVSAVRQLLRVSW